MTELVDACPACGGRLEATIVQETYYSNCTFKFRKDGQVEVVDWGDEEFAGDPNVVEERAYCENDCTTEVMFDAYRA